MENQDIVTIKWRNGKAEIRPVNNLAKNWAFDEETIDEAYLAHFMGVIAEKAEMSVNDLQHLFPAVLRMLKNNSDWAI